MTTKDAWDPFVHPIRFGELDIKGQQKALGSLRKAIGLPRNCTSEEHFVHSFGRRTRDTGGDADRNGNNCNLRPHPWGTWMQEQNLKRAKEAEVRHREQEKQK